MSQYIVHAVNTKPRPQHEGYYSPSLGAHELEFSNTYSLATINGHSTIYLKFRGKYDKTLKGLTVSISLPVTYTDAKQKIKKDLQKTSYYISEKDISLAATYAEDVSNQLSHSDSEDADIIDCTGDEHLEHSAILGPQFTNKPVEYYVDSFSAGPFSARVDLEPKGSFPSVASHIMLNIKKEEVYDAKTIQNLRSVVSKKFDAAKNEADYGKGIPNAYLKDSTISSITAKIWAYKLDNWDKEKTAQKTLSTRFNNNKLLLNHSALEHIQSSVSSCNKPDYLSVKMSDIDDNYLEHAANPYPYRPDVKLDGNQLVITFTDVTNNRTATLSVNLVGAKNYKDVEDRLDNLLQAAYDDGKDWGNISKNAFDNIMRQVRALNIFNDKTVFNHYVKRKSQK